MRTLCLVIVLGFATCALAAPPQSGTRVSKAAAVQATAKPSGYWCRTVDGRSVWVPNKTEAVAAKTGATNTPPQSSTAVRRYSYRPIVQTSYPDDITPEVVNGVEWYLNGRSYFSD